MIFVVVVVCLQLSGKSMSSVLVKNWAATMPMVQTIEYKMLAFHGPTNLPNWISKGAKVEPDSPTVFVMLVPVCLTTVG